MDGFTYLQKVHGIQRYPVCETLKRVPDPTSLHGFKSAAFPAFNVSVPRIRFESMPLAGYRTHAIQD